MAFYKGGIKRQIEFGQPYQHERQINQHILFIYFSIVYRISRALPWSHLTSISAYLPSENTNKAYLKTKMSIEGWTLDTWSYFGVTLLKLCKLQASNFLKINQLSQKLEI